MNISKKLYEITREKMMILELIEAVSNEYRYDFSKKKTFFNMETDDSTVYFPHYYGNISDCFKTFIFDRETNMGKFTLNRSINIENHDTICIKELNIESMCFTKTYLKHIAVYAQEEILKKDIEYDFMCIEIDYR